MNGPLFRVADDLTLWIADGGSIHVKTRGSHGDPVELSEEDALELAAILTKLVDELRAYGDRMEPPWTKYPEIPADSIGWRMGVGEGYYNRFYRMFSALPLAEQMEYESRHPAPPDWSGIYERIRAHPWT